MIPPVISARDLSKRYGSKTVLDGLNLRVASGQIAGLFGSNGSGKSTLLRILAGAIRPTRGSVAVTGLTGYVAQKFSLYHDLSVEENLTFFARCYGLSDASVRSNIEDVLQRLDLAQFRRDRTSHLSHGWKQRLSLAAALCHRPAVLLLDEATAGIDPIARTDLWKILRSYAESGTAIVLATHFTDEAEHCHFTAYLERGALTPMPSRAAKVSP
jgi:ABC-2 type transport system ATP-binding protein